VTVVVGGRQTNFDPAASQVNFRPTTTTVIVEFPSSSCVRGAAPVRKRQIAAARRAFTRACGRPLASSFKALNGTATITGVGFFDFLHGQTGVAPNGIELHTVLEFRTRRRLELPG
jgi:hypothetical protein